MRTCFEHCLASGCQVCACVEWFAEHGFEHEHFLAEGLAVVGVQFLPALGVEPGARLDLFQDVERANQVGGQLGTEILAGAVDARADGLGVDVGVGHGGYLRLPAQGYVGDVALHVPLGGAHGGGQRHASFAQALPGESAQAVEAPADTAEVEEFAQQCPPVLAAYQRQRLQAPLRGRRLSADVVQHLRVAGQHRAVQGSGKHKAV